MNSPEESRLEVSVKWFDQWHFYWSCSETTWKQISEKLKSPLAKGITVGAGIAIGIGISVSVYIQIDKALNPAARSTPLEAPAPKQ